MTPDQALRAAIGLTPRKRRWTAADTLRAALGHAPGADVDNRTRPAALAEPDEPAADEPPRPKVGTPAAAAGTGPYTPPKRTPDELLRRSIGL